MMGHSHTHEGGGYKRILASLLVPVAFLGTVTAASPTSKATAGMYGTAQDSVSSKTGMSSIEFDNVFVYGNYDTESINIGTATHFSDIWLGFEYSGNFWNNTSNDVVDPLNTLGTATTHGSVGKSEPSNSVKTTMHFANTPFPMGLHLGFTLGGKFESGEYTFANNSFTQRTDYDNTYDRGYINNLTYTPSFGYKISIPVGDVTISPTIQLDLSISQNDAYAKYTTADKKVNSLEQKQLTYLPIASIQVDTDLPRGESISHTIGAQYDFSQTFAQNKTFTQKDGEGTTITEIKADQKQTHLALLRYTQKRSVTEQVRFAWQFRLSTELSNQVLPYRMIYDTNTGWKSAGGEETVTTINGGTPLKTADDDNRVYETTIKGITLAPLFKFGLQWDVVPAKLVFNAGVEFEPFAFSRTEMKTVVKETLQASNTQAKTVEKTDMTFDTPLGKFATGLTFHIAPTVVLDTAVALDISRKDISNLTINNILNKSLVMLSLNMKL